MSEEKHIPGQPPVPPEERILSYLTGSMADAEQHRFEEEATSDDFINDALDGLQSLPQQTNVSNITQQLNADLKKQLAKKNKRKEKRKYQEQAWIYFAVILILLLLVAAFLVINAFG